MTDKEKLERALETLKEISESQVATRECIVEFASERLASLTEPQMKTVKGWVNVYPVSTHKDSASCVYLSREEADIGASSGRIDCVEITCRRPIPEPKEEVWEREVLVDLDDGSGVIYLPREWVGCRVEVRLKKEVEG